MASKTVSTFDVPHGPSWYRIELEQCGQRKRLLVDGIEKPMRFGVVNEILSSPEPIIKGMVFIDFDLEGHKFNITCEKIGAAQICDLHMDHRRIPCFNPQDDSEYAI
uniref:Methyltransferase n=1 Tax=Caenorhabditis tropicalis TaxID=1561998 RepID=A0A1I7USL0_9PELO